MKNVYILTEEGRAWGQAGLDWIENVMKPDLGETDQLQVCAGYLYNSPGLMVKELTEHPDSYVILSYERIDVIYGDEIVEFRELLQKHLDNDEYPSCWEVLKEEYLKV